MVELLGQLVRDIVDIITVMMSAFMDSEFTI